MNAKSLKIKSRTDWDRIDAMSDDEIDCSDIPELDCNFMKNATIRLPKADSSISIRVDNDIFQWFKSHDKDYLTVINSVLRSYMNSHTAA